MNHNFLTQNFRVILRLAKMDFRKRYLGTALGAIWALLMPLTTILLIYFVMTYGLKAGRLGEVSFVNWLVPGMLAWFFMSECISTASSAFIEYSYLVTKMRFNVLLLTPVRIVAAMPVHIILIVLFMASLLIAKEANISMWVQLVYYFGCAVVLCFSIALMVSTAQVFIRDVANMVNVVLQMFFWATPLFWNPDLLRGTSFTFILYSPFNYVVSGYRDSLIFGVPFWHKPFETLVFWFICLFCLLFAALLFKRLRPHFADVL